ncbi:MAG: hypothetical protein M3P93_02845 [Actinomycetota bacterium]|nr:hypothetical protein [Actinomycetota bacterium]
MIDRPTALVCTGYGTHAVRELVVLVPVAPRSDLALMGFVSVGTGEPWSPPRREPTGEERRGFGVEGSLTTISPSGQRVRHKTEARIINTPGIGWQVVAPGCKTCRQAAVSQRVDTIAAYVAAHFPPGESRVDVDLRPPPSGTTA